MFGPIVPASGPNNAKICVVGEAPGDEETRRLTPFIGPSGQELRRMFRTVGLNQDDCYVTNVFNTQPRDNNLGHFCLPAGDSGRSVGVEQPLGPLTSNPTLFCSPEHLHHVARLHAELDSVRPHVVLLLGNTACWAMGLGLGLKSLRGTLHTQHVSDKSPPLKLLPTYHPSAILRQWDLRTIALADIQKASNESHSPELHFDNTSLWLAPTLDDIAEFDRLHMDTASIVACDIETKRGQITCISFAPTPHISLVIPFWREGQTPNYWPDSGTEAHAWAYVRKWMERADLTKVFQNGLYDLQYLQAHCRPRACTEDTMLLHHSLYSELPKNLGFLGSIYANVQSWKKLRTFSKADIMKRDD